MKKLFSNSGMTLLELVVASVILAIITIPILTTIIQTAKTNMSSDVKLKMDAQIQRALEEIRLSDNIASTVDGNNYSLGVFYDRSFNRVDPTDTDFDTKKCYKITVGLAGADVPLNEIDKKTSTEIKNYDRWDFAIDIKDSDGTNSDIVIYKNEGNIDTNVEAAGGLLFKKDTTVGSTLISNQLTLEFSESSGAYTLSYGTSTTPYSYGFNPGYGTNDTSKPLFVEANNIITVNLNRDTINPPNDFHIKVINNTNNTKNIALSIFNDDSSDPKVSYETLGMVDVGIFETSLEKYRIQNGSKVKIQVWDIAKNIVIEDLTTVIGKKLE